MKENHRKTVATILFWCLLVCYFSVVGSCVVTFAYNDKKIEVGKVNLLCFGCLICDKDGSKIDEPKFKQPKTGLKPATGELDDVSKIPYTVSSEVGSEGAYFQFYVKSSVPYRIEIKNIKFDGGEEERENVYACLEDEENESVSFENDTLLLLRNNGYNNFEKHTLLIWISEFATEKLVGAKIGFDLVVTTI